MNKQPADAAVQKERTTTEETVDNSKKTNGKKSKASQNKASASRRHNRQGKRRGRYGYAAPLGVVITILSLLGVAAILFFGVTAIRRAADTTALKEEMYYFLEPLMAYNPEPFEGIEDTEQDAFLNAAAYKLARAEQIRMLRENDENSVYPVDDQGRIAIPLEQIESAYNSLFSTASPLTHHTVEEDGLTFSQTDNCYYVPFDAVNSGYRGVIDTVRRSRSAYIVRVGYVANGDVKLDEHGNEIPPTASMATYYQTYTLIRYDDGYYVNACTNS